MQFQNFKIFIVKVISEGDRLQKHDINGVLLTKKRFTNMQKSAILFALLSLFLLPKGFSDSFAGYIISFLAIFIGLFTSIVISMYDRSSSLFEGYREKEQFDKVRALQIKNYLTQFTGLTSYSILLSLVVIILLSVALLDIGFQTNVFNFRVVQNINEINTRSIICFLKILGLLIHRFFIVYFLSNFFIITTFSTTSYFSFLLSEYKKLKIKND